MSAKLAKSKIFIKNPNKIKLFILQKKKVNYKCSCWGYEKKA